MVTERLTGMRAGARMAIVFSHRPARCGLLVAVVVATLGGIACDRVYYKTMKRFGMEKRDILVDRVRDAQKAQTEAKQEFQTALERFKTVIEVENSPLDKKYETLSKELERSEDKAKRVHDRIKHNLNARAIGALGNELVTMRDDVESLVAGLEAAITEADTFIKEMDADKASGSQSP